ncbi:hypothetical protein [Streptomyces sp. NPDC021224]|uniref:hypothetical protein n=1 Tax=unclassified Streptomyces TaxID=2593676 RepID=UPI00379CAAD3
MTRTADRCEPSAAERVRSILTAAGSAAVTANGAHEDFLTGVDADLDGGTLLLTVPVDSGAAAEASRGPAVGIPAVLEWTDLAPVPVRDRVRAQVRITARLPFPHPLTGPDELGHHIHALLTRAFHERHHTRYGRRRR